MGLAERRAVKAFQDNKYPEFKRQIDEAAGFDLPVEVHWDSLSTNGEGYANILEDTLAKVYFIPLVDALKAITIDDMGKEALKAGLAKVVIQAVDPTKLVFEDKVLLFDHNPCSNVDYGDARKKTLQQELERGL